MADSPALSLTLLGQIFRRNRTRLVKKFSGHRDTPWMRPYEEDLLRELLSALRPSRCLEWGGGLSTLQFPALLAADARWTAIEHDTGWARQLATMISRPGVSVKHVPANAASVTGDGTDAEFADYLDAAKADAPYDFIFIDGRARAACVTRAYDLLTPTGIVVLHDANRDAYLEACTRYPKQLLFRDGRRGGRKPAGGVWLGGKERDPATLLDLELHRRVWAFYSGVGRWLA
jgi:predicted O-methyltransferase YrrM